MTGDVLNTYNEGVYIVHLQTNLEGVQIDNNGSISFLYGLFEKEHNDLEVIKLI
jgi:hypothetical protein